YAEPYDPEAPLPSYDLEESPAVRRLVDSYPVDPLNQVDDPFLSARAPGAPAYHQTEEDLDQLLESEPVNPAMQAAAPVEGVEEALEEAEFFVSRGLIDDARGILVDALARSPNHPLL